MENKKCLICGVAFETKSKKRAFCSEGCKKKFLYLKSKDYSERSCVRCGTIFIPRRINQFYCSAVCQKKTSDCKIHDVGKFSGYRELVLKRDKYRCVECGSIEGLNVHHKDESGQSDNPNNEPTNLITLCNACHIKAHNVSRWMHDETEHTVMTKCQQCGKEFRESKLRIEGGRGKYCSKECFHKAETGIHKTSFTANCQVCGKDFFTTEYKLSIGKGKYCSKECSATAQRGRSKPKPITKQITVNCPICGKSFNTTQVRINDGRGKYCSKECGNISKKSNPNITGRKPHSRTYVNCVVCGKEFWVTQYAIDHGRGKYCGRECYDNARKQTQLST